MLLLPQRDPNTVAAIAAGLLGFLLLLDRRFFARAAMLKHRDGVTMRLALLLPLLILVGRSLMLHGGSPVLVGFVLVSFGGFMFLGWPSCCTSDGLKTLVRLFGFGMVAIGWAVVTDWILKAIDWDSSEPVITVGLLPIAGAALLLSTRAGNDGRTYRRLASAGAMAAMLFHLTTFGGVGSILLALGMAVAMVAGAFWVTDRTILISGVMGFVFTLLYGLFMVREFWAQNLWVSLSALGVAILITSSLIERNWQRLTQRGTELVEGWQSWD